MSVVFFFLRVLSMVDTWSLDKKTVPLFQEEDPQQRALIGLLFSPFFSSPLTTPLFTSLLLSTHPFRPLLRMVDKLREHLTRHLPRLGKKRIDSLVVNYVAKLVGMLRLSSPSSPSSSPSLFSPPHPLPLPPPPPLPTTHFLSILLTI
ncbi:hypothetical protein N1851_033960 [Merluccius polli]|uniref:Uncharacterized protein n=1 Tax=Merluccius polli TaxID=89951 RepID=A0AA47M0I2_MERPO|nr:hypothetical protein N1851_033960 [Merluccius polli]